MGYREWDIEDRISRLGFRGSGVENGIYIGGEIMRVIYRGWDIEVGISGDVESAMFRV